MTAREESNWKRFFMIRGPAGEERLDVYFAWLHQAIRAGYAEPRPSIEDCRLKFDYRRHFPKEDIAEEIADCIDAEADMAFLESRFGKSACHH
jgi:hypothetical protein